MDGRAMTEQAFWTPPRMAMRDASWYARPSQNRPVVYHVATKDWTPACNPRRVLLVEETALPVSGTSVHSRCERPACRSRWEAVA